MINNLHSKTDGLIFNENNNNSCYKDINGNIWFGTTEGLVHYSSDKDHNKINEPRTSILLITINNQGFNSKDRISLSYNEYSVKIDFIGIFLTDPQKVYYKYRMLGLDPYGDILMKEFLNIPNLLMVNIRFR